MGIVFITMPFLIILIVYIAIFLLSILNYTVNGPFTTTDTFGVPLKLILLTVNVPPLVAVSAYTQHRPELSEYTPRTCADPCGA